MSFAAPLFGRIVRGQMATSRKTHGDTGAFRFRSPVVGRALYVIASNGMGWEHVSVSLTGRKERTPTWAEMCFVKDLFWGEEDVVIQYHPRKSEYVNYHEACLHLWRKVGVEIETPPPITVGPVDA